MSPLHHSRKITERSIDKGATILTALKLMDKINRKLLLVFHKDKFTGLLSIGDIQRAIIANKSLDQSVQSILRENIKVAGSSDDFDHIRQVMFDSRVEIMPVVDESGSLIDAIFWEDLFPEKEAKDTRKLNLPVVIMAGGEGKRLRPLTNILPKPLIPIDEKTIVEHIMDNFVEIGCKEFHLSVNYKADFIRFYLDGLSNSPYRIRYFQEKSPLGTAGSLYLLKGRISSRFFVTNCDIIIDQDYSEIVDFHVASGNELTIVSALKHVSLPYGTVETGAEGALVSLKEKPEITYKVNTGFYILEPSLLDQIPENRFYNITDLIQKILDRKGKVGVFPVSENSWKDIGDWSEYIRNSKPAKLD